MFEVGIKLIIFSFNSSFHQSANELMKCRRVVAWFGMSESEEVLTGQWLDCIRNDNIGL